MLQLQPGSHRLYLVKPGFAPFDETRTLAPRPGRLLARRARVDHARRAAPASSAAASRRRAATRERIREGSAHALIEELTHFPAMEDFRPRAGELSMPVLIRVGDADPSTPAVAAEAFAKNVKQCRLEVVPGVAHHYLAQDFEGTVASIQRFAGG